MTGLYPSRHGVYNNVSNPTAIHDGLLPGVRTWSESLRDSGYHLGYAGKWHVSNRENPSSRGWEQGAVFSGADSNKRDPDRRRRQIEQMSAKSSKSPDTPRARGQVRRPGWGDYQLYGSVPDGGPHGYENTPDHRIVQSGIELMRKFAPQGEPWCVYAGTSGPHDPFIVPEKYARMYDPAQVPLPPSFYDNLEDKPRVYRRMRRQFWDQLSEDEVRESIAHYWGYCSLQDDLFGLLLDALDETGQAENTLVLRLSDHGEYAGAHGLYCKGVPAFREAYHIPCIARWPRGIQNPGRVIDEFVSLADFAPTFTELAQTQPLQTPDDKPLSGRTFAPLLRDEKPTDWPDAHFTQLNGVELYYTQRSVTTRDWKYVYNGFDDDELYDGRADPHELINLAARPEHEAVKRDLVRRMWRFAEQENDDLIFNAYATVALAPFGPADTG